MSDEAIKYVIFAVILVVAILVTWFLAIAYRKNVAEAKLGKAEDKAREIIDEALKAAEAKKRETLLEAKEEAMKTKNEIDKEVKDRRNELQRMEKRVLSREENLDRKTEAVEKKEASLSRKEAELTKLKQEVSDLEAKRTQELERISGLTSEQAKEYLLKTVEDEVKHETAVMIKELETRAKEEADKKAKDYVVTAIQKCAVDHVSETTISLVQLPNDEMKGRIIGREGRNIRTLETMTGVDLIIDDTPETIVLSSFDPLRREIAKVTIENLIKDGRIHPGRIEEIYDKTCKEINAKIIEKGEEAIFGLGISKIDPELVEIIGKLHFRTSYGQNALQHSIEVANLAGLLAAEVGENVSLAKRAGLLHDIGKAIDFEAEGSHVEIGEKIAKKYDEDEVVINAIASHHGDTPATSVISSLVAIADTISASRPGARNDSLENYVKRLQQLEEIANSFDGVEKSFAMQAGRDLRVIVKPEEMDELTSIKVARDIKDRIENEMQYPGTIRITVIRETRAVEEAR